MAPNTALKCSCMLMLIATLNAASAADETNFDHDHIGLTNFYAQVVVPEGETQSRVDYAEAYKRRDDLQDYLNTLSTVTAAAFDRFSADNQRAMLINLYNASMIEKILTRYPDIDSVWDFGRVFNHPFKDNFIELMGRRVSLDDIEHGWLRGKPELFDPRVHFVVNCASMGCPMLRAEAYRGKTLNKALDQQANRFLSDPTKNGYDPSRQKLRLSPLFKWYQEDFEVSGYPGEFAYLQRFSVALGLDRQAVEALRLGSLPIIWTDYDWALNDTSGLREALP